MRVAWRWSWSSSNSTKHAVNCRVLSVEARAHCRISGRKNTRCGSELPLVLSALLCCASRRAIQYSKHSSFLDSAPQMQLLRFDERQSRVDCVMSVAATATTRFLLLSADGSESSGEEYARSIALYDESTNAIERQ